MQKESQCSSCRALTVNVESVIVTLIQTADCYCYNALLVIVFLSFFLLLLLLIVHDYYVFADVARVNVHTLRCIQLLLFSPVTSHPMLIGKKGPL